MNTTTQTTPLDTLIVHWAWDILYPLNGQKQLVGPHGFEHAGTAKLIGAEDWFDEEQDEFDPVAACWLFPFGCTPVPIWRAPARCWAR